jgi:hypothetical protein
MTNPHNFSATFETDDPEAPERIQKVIDICLDIAFEVSKDIIEGRPNENAVVLTFLQQA